MGLWRQMLRTLPFGPSGRRRGTQGRAFGLWPPCPPLPRLLNATELVSHWTGIFEKRGIPEAQVSSEYIVAHVLGAKTFQSLQPVLRTQPLTPQQLLCIQELCSYRLQRMPVQYILGEWDFQGLSLKMAPPVFIPRPETEELVEWVLEEMSQRPHVIGQDGPRILEVGCGSGAISLSLLTQLPEALAIEKKTLLQVPSSSDGKCRWEMHLLGWDLLLPAFHLFFEQSQVIAVDKEEAAISLTSENAQRLQLQDRIWTILLDVTSEESWTHLLPWGSVDLVVSNPPYVFHQDMEQLAAEIRSYEDPVALDGGDEGMDIITDILTLAPRLLKDSGSIFLEVDPRHPELVSNWLQSQPDLYLNLVAVRKDFYGKPRFLHVQRSGP